MSTIAGLCGNAQYLYVVVLIIAFAEFETCVTERNTGDMNNGNCVLTYNWGDSYKRYLSTNETLRGKFGVAPTPGSTVVLNRETGELVTCDETLCPSSDFYEDIGWVNRAPYLAFSGWYVQRT